MLNLSKVLTLMNASVLRNCPLKTRIHATAGLKSQNVCAFIENKIHCYYMSAL